MGTRDNLVAHKAEALPRLHRQIRAWCEENERPAVFETTGLSDAPFVDELQRDAGCVVVRLEVSEREALARVASRAPGHHLTDDPDATRRVWNAFAAVVSAPRRVDLVIDTEQTTPEEAARLIAATFGQPLD